MSDRMDITKPSDPKEVRTWQRYVGFGRDVLRLEEEALKKAHGEVSEIRRRAIKYAAPDEPPSPEDLARYDTIIDLISRKLQIIESVTICRMLDLELPVWAESGVPEDAGAERNEEGASKPWRIERNERMRADYPALKDKWGQYQAMLEIADREGLAYDTTKKIIYQSGSYADDP